LGRDDPNLAGNEQHEKAAPNGGGIILAWLCYNHAAPSGAAVGAMGIGGRGTW